MTQVPAPARPRPVAPPARPRPTQAADIIAPRTAAVQEDAPPRVQSAAGFEPTGLKAPPLPAGVTGWQNGSAVFQAGYSGRERAWIKPLEFQDGFLGRLHHEANGEIAVYAYVKAARSYRFVGRRKGHVEAITLL